MFDVAELCLKAIPNASARGWLDSPPPECRLGAAHCISYRVTQVLDLRTTGISIAKSGARFTCSWVWARLGGIGDALYRAAALALPSASNAEMRGVMNRFRQLGQKYVGDDNVRD